MRVRADRWLTGCAALLVTVAGLADARAQQRPGLRPAGPPVQSPSVGDGGSISFRIRADRAQTVRLMGSDIPQVGQGLDLQKSAEGVWELTIGPVAPGTYRYRFEIDGVATNDPVNPEISQSHTHVWSVVHVPGAEWMDLRQVPHGAVAQVTYYSSSLDRFRRMHVYTPPGYEADAERRYPVLYLLHGAFDSDNSWSTVGRAALILDNLLAEGQAVPMICVMPAGHTGPFRFGRDQLPLDEFSRDFTEDVLPYVESHYRVLTGREHRALAGLSMGGAQTLNVAIRGLDRFAYLGVFSSGVFGIGGRGPGAEGPSWEEQHRDVLENAQLKDGLRLVWFATGVDDFLIDTSRATVELLRKYGFHVTYHETTGGHTWTNWREYLRDFAPQLFAE